MGRIIRIGTLVENVPTAIDLGMVTPGKLLIKNQGANDIRFAYNAVDVQDFGNDSVLSQKIDKGGSKLVAEKRIKISSSDGIDTLAYAIPTFDVGFSDDGRSKNPGSGRLVNAEKDNRPKKYKCTHEKK